MQSRQWQQEKNSLRTAFNIKISIQHYTTHDNHWNGSYVFSYNILKHTLGHNREISCLLRGIWCQFRCLRVSKIFREFNLWKTHAILAPDEKVWSTSSGTRCQCTSNWIKPIQSNIRFLPSITESKCLTEVKSREFTHHRSLMSIQLTIFV